VKKLTEDYIPRFGKPECILSDHGTQFTSPKWTNGLGGLRMRIRYSPVRHPASNPCERYVREISKYFLIYCHQNHKQWPELIPYMEEWINSAISEATGFTSAELMTGEQPVSIFERLLPPRPDTTPDTVTYEEKVLQAYARMRV
jgi:transposase InsO family protein